MIDNPLIIETLEKFYNCLYNNLIKKYKKEKYKSIIFWFLEIKGPDRMRIVQDSKIKKIKIPKEIFIELEKEEMIKETDKLGEYVITAKGIWFYEKEKDIFSDQKLLEYLDNKYFSTYSDDAKSSDKQKVVLFSMIATRAFSENSLLDLKKSEQLLNELEKILKESYELLRSFGVVSEMNEKDLFGKQGPEHKVVNVIRHSDDIKKKTKGIYITVLPQKHYLNIYINNKINVDNLKFIFKQILGDKKLTHSEIDLMCKFCDEIATSRNVYLFDLKSHIFHKPEFDNFIRDALITLYN